MKKLSLGTVVMTVLVFIVTGAVAQQQTSIAADTGESLSSILLSKIWIGGIDSHRPEFPTSEDAGVTFIFQPSPQEKVNATIIFKDGKMAHDEHVAGRRFPGDTEADINSGTSSVELVDDKSFVISRPRYTWSCSLQTQTVLSCGRKNKKDGHNDPPFIMRAVSP